MEDALKVLNKLTITLYVLSSLTKFASDVLWDHSLMILAFVKLLIHCATHSINLMEPVQVVSQDMDFKEDDVF